MKAIFRLNVYIGLGAMLLALILLALDVPFMKTWFYIFAWWPLLIILDGLNFRISGHSPLYDSPGNFFLRHLFPSPFGSFSSSST